MIYNINIKKYKPTEINDLVYNDDTLNYLLNYNDNKEDIVICNNSGIGKTTFVKYISNKYNNVCYYTCNSKNINEIIDKLDLNKKIIVIDEFEYIPFNKQFMLLKYLKETYKDIHIIIIAHAYSNIDINIINDLGFKKISIDLDNEKVKNRFKFIFNEENMSYDEDYINNLIKIYNDDVRTMLHISFYLYDKYKTLSSILLYEHSENELCINEHSKNELNNIFITFFDNLLSIDDSEQLFCLCKMPIEDNIGRMFKINDPRYELLSTKENVDMMYDLLLQYLFEKKFNNSELLITVNKYKMYNNNIDERQYTLNFECCILELQEILRNSQK